MKKKKKPHHEPKKAPPVRARNRCLLLILVDERPLRAAAIRLYRETEDALATVRERLEIFETKDLPAWHQWEAATFGPLLTECRRLELEIGQCAELLDEIGEEQFWSGCSRPAAYRRVMKQREEGAPKEDFEDDGFDPPPPGESEPERPGVYGDSDLPAGMSAEDFDSMSRREQNAFREEYADLAEMFEIFTGLPAPHLDDVLERERQSHRSAPYSAGERGGAPKDAARVRLRDLYRSLVRRLHPDVHGALTAREQEIWHQVQDAWQMGNLEKMEALAGRFEMGLQGDGQQLPLEVLRRMAADLLEGLEKLRAQLGLHARHVAWKFSEAKRRDKLEARRRKELERLVRDRQAELAFLRSDLDQLAVKANKAKAKPKPAPAVGKAKARSFVQDELPF